MNTKATKANRSKKDIEFYAYYKTTLGGHKNKKLTSTYKSSFCKDF